MRPSEIAEVIDREFRAAGSGAHTLAMLWGPPGVGKSQIVAQGAARHGMQFPEFAPGYPVLWLVKGNSPVPWGERVQLN